MASLIPGFEYDIFISYRQKDNKGDKWVTEFVTALRTELEATMKDDLSVYFDENPHDGLLETHDVDASLKEKLRCLVFIPVISRTYCDPRSFAWAHEFTEFVAMASKDRFGLRIKLEGGNIACRVLPVRIHEINPSDHKICEETLGGMLRPVDFIYNSPGVNRPLRINEDHPHDNLNKIYYRDQINKVANAVDEMIRSLKSYQLAGISDTGTGGGEVVDLDDPRFFEGIGTPDISKKGDRNLATFKGPDSRKGMFGGTKQSQNLKKYLYFLLILLPLIGVLIGWNGLSKIFGPGKAKTEEANQHAFNATQLFNSGQPEAAKREAALALSLNPKCSSALTTLSAVSFKEGDIPKAIELTLEALKADPHNSTAAFNLALEFYDSGDKRQAAEWASRSINIDSSKVVAYSLLGRIYSESNQTADAVLLLSTAEKKYPQSEYIHAVYKNLGIAYLSLNQSAPAIKYLELSVSLSPEVSETNYYLARAYEVSGDTIRSIDYWKKYITLESDSAKSAEAQKHLREITVKHLKDLLK
jgi:tetratricopeptide (TPR) repeat protein